MVSILVFALTRIGGMAVTKAIDEGKPIPPQTRRGDPPPADLPK